MPDWVSPQRHQIWIYDITWFTRAGRAACAILDAAGREWPAALVAAEAPAA